MWISVKYVLYLAPLSRMWLIFGSFVQNVAREWFTKARSNTMPKAILELEMPESCWQCPCIQDRTETYRWCGVVGGDCPNPPYEKRRDECPLKPVELP